MWVFDLQSEDFGQLQYWYDDRSYRLVATFEMDKLVCISDIVRQIIAYCRAEHVDCSKELQVTLPGETKTLFVKGKEFTMGQECLNRFSQENVKRILSILYEAIAGDTPTDFLTKPPIPLLRGVSAESQDRIETVIISDRPEGDNTRWVITLNNEITPDSEGVVTAGYKHITLVLGESKTSLSIADVKANLRPLLDVGSGLVPSGEIFFDVGKAFHKGDWIQLYAHQEEGKQEIYLRVLDRTLQQRKIGLSVEVLFTLAKCISLAQTKRHACDVEEGDHLALCLLPCPNETCGSGYIKLGDKYCTHCGEPLPSSSKYNTGHALRSGSADSSEAESKSAEP